MPTANIPALRRELDLVRLAIADWKRRGSPESERAALTAHLAASEAAVADAISAPQGAAPMPMSSTQRVAKTVLDRETNARFWAQTNYKVGQKLDPKGNPTDKAMARVWLDIAAKVKAEDAAGKLVLTYNHPAVDQHLAEATTAQATAVEHLENGATAAGQGKPDEAAIHAAAAAQAHEAAHAAAQTAAAFQPPTVSPEVAQIAATEAAQSAGQAPPPPIEIAHDHPARGPAAQPARPTEFFNAPTPAPAEPDDDNVVELRAKIRALVASRFGGSFRAMFDRYTGGQLGDRSTLTKLFEDAGVGNFLTRGAWVDGAMARVDADHDGKISWQEFQDTLEPPGADSRDVGHHVAIAQAVAAPAKATQVHQIAAQVAASSGGPQTTMPPETIAQIRDEAKARAQSSGKRFSGVALMPNDQWTVEGFDSQDALDGWYGTLTDHPEAFRYAAAFVDQGPGPDDAYNEVFGSGQAIPVSVTSTVDYRMPMPATSTIDYRVPAPAPSPIAAKATTGGGGMAALAAVAVTAGAAMFAGRKKKGLRR